MASWGKGQMQAGSVTLWGAEPICLSKEIPEATEFCLPYAKFC